MSQVPLIGAPKKEEAPAVVEAVTAFLVYIDKNGMTVASPNLDLTVITDHEVRPHELLHAVTDVKNGIETQQSAMLAAEFVMARLQAFGAQQMNAMQNNDIMGKLGNVRG